ncbi:MAG: ABC transporter ATP-binding protein/permease [candidate division Zixibacteria bacterium]|nr:ABC transporter ATP-binding protein/permease [candidate division Zixibacteria bacterium]
MLAKIKWFWKYYRDYPGVIAILLLLTPIQVALQVTIPRLIGFTVDVLKTGELPEHWLAIGLADLGLKYDLGPTESFGCAFIILGLFSHIMYAYFQSWRAWMNLKLEWLFRQDAFNQIVTKGPDFFNRFRTGDLITRMTDDVAEKLSWFACSGIFRLYEACLAVTFIIVMMISIDPILTLWTTGPLPLLIVIFFITSSLLDKRYDWLQKKISNFNDTMEACFSGVRVVKAYVRETAQMKKFNEAARDRRKAEIGAVKVTTVVDSLYNYIWQFGVVIVLVAGGYKVLYSDLSIGDLATFIYYVTWLVFPMFDIGQFLVKSRQSAVSINRLLELENVPPMVADNGTSNGDRLAGGLNLQNVSFAFEGSEHRILSDVSIEIEAGQTVAIVGKIGSGKSWLVNMIPRLVDPTGGMIDLDGRDLRQFTLEDLRRNVGFVPQEPVLFNDTIRNNILIGRDGISPALIDWAIEVSQLGQDLKDFTEGLETPIGTRGVAISGGQKQRLGLARALVGKPQLLILDDCTSALDSDTEAALWDRLNEVMPEITAILITHRPDTLERADKIFVLDEGRLAEEGTHAALIAREGLYARIYKRYQLAEEVG